MDLINGGWWTLAINGETVNIQQFGAKPVGGFDNRAAIQAAINFVCNDKVEQRKPVLRIPDGQFNYTGQLFIPYSALQFMIVGSDVLAATLYRSVPENTAGIIDQGYMTTYRGWTLAQAENTLDNPANIGVLVKRPLGSLADIDVTFQDFRCTRFYYAMETWGRGVRVANCGLNLCRWAINLEWPSVGDYIEGDQPVQKDLTGFRAINIHGNRFHSNLDGGVRNAGANAHKISGVQCYGNHMDIGRTLWDGVLRRAIVYGNTINMTPVEAFNLTDGSEEYHIFGNQISGDLNAVRTPNNFYRMTGNHKSFRIENEVLSYCKEHGFNMRDGTFTGGVISGITFVRPCSSGDTFCPITIIAENSIVDINDITLITDQTLTGIVRGAHNSSTIYVGKVRTVGNATPKTVGSSGVLSTPHGEVGLDAENWWSKLTRGGVVTGGLKYASAGTSGLTLYSSGSLNLESATASIRPMTDNAYNLGTSLFRFAQVFAGTGIINTSDEREKRLIGDIPDVWLDAWSKVQWCRFKYNNGERWHLGLIAQQVRDAFLLHGVDAFEIGLLCLDEWDNAEAEYDVQGVEISPAIKKGHRYGIRYSEAEAMEAAWQRREIVRLKQLVAPQPH